MTALFAIGRFLIGKWGVSLLWVPLVLAGIGLFAKVQYDAYQRGVTATNNAINLETLKIEEKWKRIDTSRITFDDAISGLRDRANDR